MNKEETQITVCLAGNPNVGKSTVFNQLTGLKQHTGNWSGKTVNNACGNCRYAMDYQLIDVPGCYSIMANSHEEEVARDYICFGNPDVIIVVCDATCLERNLNLVLQILEVKRQVIVCVNMMDEAKRKQIDIKLDILSKELAIPVVATTARKNQGLCDLVEELNHMREERTVPNPILYPIEIQQAVFSIEEELKRQIEGEKSEEFLHWLAARMLDQDASMQASIERYLGKEVTQSEELSLLIQEEKKKLESKGYTQEKIRDRMAATFVNKAEEITKKSIIYNDCRYAKKDRFLDFLFTSKCTGFPIMFLFLLGIFWLTITGANYPSELLGDFFAWGEERLIGLFLQLKVPQLLSDVLIQGIYRVTTCVISVMLPPMAIFFPLFTLMEDFGYLPRIAYNLDRCFKKCAACGKQALTMCMGFGCNAAGVVGCRIIDSPRERLIAVLTNNLVPCNGRFPTMIAIISMFFVSRMHAPMAVKSFLSAIFLAAIIVLAFVMTFAVSKILSKTILKGLPSSFTLELPPYRRPQVGKVIVRSMLDRTVFVLARALVTAVPAGFLIWILANTTIGTDSLLTYCAGFLDPFAALLGLDGVILLAFILGLPANEIVLPIILMAYMSQGTLVEMNNLKELQTILISHGWTLKTAVCTILFSLMHWPCATTCLTIRKESGTKWMLLSIAVCTIPGILLCFCVASAFSFFGC